MKLIHYTNEPFDLEPRNYDEEELSRHAKPNGLWVSVEGEYDWFWWCIEGAYYLDCLAVSYEVFLKEDANILHLKTADEIRAFGKMYQVPSKWPWVEGDVSELRWSEIKEKYQGIVIAPYQWDCRMADETGWYYGWDCASGCIWDLDCIKEFTLR